MNVSIQYENLLNQRSCHIHGPAMTGTGHVWISMRSGHEQATRRVQAGANAWEIGIRPIAACKPHHEIRI